jgi:hypothetical protein
MMHAWGSSAWISSGPLEAHQPGGLAQHVHCGMLWFTACRRELSVEFLQKADCCRTQKAKTADIGFGCSMLLQYWV